MHRGLKHTRQDSKLAHYCRRNEDGSNSQPAPVGQAMKRVGSVAEFAVLEGADEFHVVIEGWFVVQALEPAPLSIRVVMGLWRVARPAEPLSVVLRLSQHLLLQESMAGAEDRLSPPSLDPAIPQRTA